MWAARKAAIVGVDTVWVGVPVIDAELLTVAAWEKPQRTTPFIAYRINDGRQFDDPNETMDLPHSQANWWPE